MAKMKMTVGLLWLAVVASPAFAASMTTAEMRNALIGRELCTARTGGLIADLTFCFTYGRDGSFKMLKADSGEVTNWVFDNDQICLFKVAKPKERSCASFERQSEKRFLVNGKEPVCVGSCEE